jgi:hypothetical protein
VLRLGTAAVREGVLRREVGLGRRSATIWRLQELSEAQTPVLVHEQSDTNWVSYGLVLPAGAERFIVHNGGVGTRRLQKIVKVFDLATGQELRTFPTEVFTQDITVLTDPTGNWFAYPADPAGRFRLVRLSDLMDMGVLEGGCGAIGPSGDQFARAAGQGMVVLGRNQPAGGVALGIDWRPVFLPFFSPNEQLLAWGTAEGVVLVADLEEVMRRLEAFAQAAR